MENVHTQAYPQSDGTPHTSQTPVPYASESTSRAVSSPAVFATEYEAVVATEK